MPATTTYYDGSTTWLNPTLQEVTLDAVIANYANSCPSNYVDTEFEVHIGGTAGVNYDGTITIIIDTDGNGIYDNNDRQILSSYSTAGVYTVNWDGLDNSGNVVTLSPIDAKATVSDFTPHLALVDIEGLGGIQATSIVPNEGIVNLYWDDTNVTGTPATPIVDGTAGIDSTGGVHGWGFAIGSWGDNSIIDSWADVGADQAPVILSLSLCIAVTIEKISLGGIGSFDFIDTAAAADTITTDTAGTGVLGTTTAVVDSTSDATITETIPTGWELSSATCVDNNNAITANTDATFGSLSAVAPGVLTIPAVNLVAAADIVCTFTNTLLPIIELAKSVVQTANADGTISAAYTVTVSNTGSGDGSYDLDDTIDQLATGVSATVGTGLAYVNIDDTQVPLQSGAVGSVSAPSSAAATTNTLVTDEGIAGGSSETWTYTIIYTVDSTATPSTGGACDTTSEGLSVSNSAALDTGASDEACVELPVVELVKSVVQTANADGTISAAYTVTVSNTGSGDGSYDLDDTIDQLATGVSATVGTGLAYVNIDDTQVPLQSGAVGSVSAPSSAAATTNTLVTDEGIAGGSSETWTYTIIYTVDSTATPSTGGACDTTSEGLSVSNSAALDTGASDEACVELPVVELVKSVVQTANADGTISAAYTVTVSNTGSGDGSYDLDDTIDQLATGVSATVGTGLAYVNIDDTQVPLQSGAVGSVSAPSSAAATTNTLVTDEGIAGGSSETWTYTIIYTVDSTATPSTGGACDTTSEGLSVSNSAALDTGASDEACVELPVVELVKSVVQTANADGTISAAYTVTVSNTGSGDGSYDLDDTIDQLATGVSATVGTGLAYVNIDDTQVPLQSGAVGSVSAPSSAAATTNTLVTDEGIAGGSSETWTYTIIYTVDSTATPSTGGACDTTSEGLSVSNSAALDTGASDEACVELPVVELVKSVVQTANADGTISAAYTVTVSNTGSGDGSYDLDDTIDQLATGVSATVGTGLAYVNIDDTQVPLQSGAVGSVSAPSSAAATTNTLVTDEGIAGGSSETWTYTIIYTVDSTATPSTGGACDTTSEGLSVSNSAALDTGASDEACVELPVVELVKSVVQTANADGTISAAYTVTVSNTGSGDGSYDLDDTIDQLATGVSATVGTGLAYVNIDDTQVPLQSGAVGSVSAPSSAAATTNTLVTDEGIAGGSSETWTYTIIYTVDSTATPSTGGACDTTSEGLSVSNSAALDTGASDEACVELPVVELVKSVVQTANADGTISAAYTVTVSNTGSGDGSYDLDDTIDQLATGVSATVGTGLAYVNIDDTQVPLQSGAVGSVSAPSSAAATTNTLVTDEGIAGGSSETWTYTIIYTVDSTATPSTGGACDTTSEGLSVSNSAALDTGASDEACVELSVVELVKSVVQTANADGTISAAYTVTVSNTGSGDGSYDLDDTIDQLATGVSATVGTGLAYVNIDDTQVPLQSGAVGSVSAPSSAAATTNTLVTDEGIAGGSSETWTYTIIYTVDSTATPSTGGACDTTSVGLSVSNSAALDTGASDEACVELPVVELVKSVVQTANADGTISAAYTVTVSNTGSGDGSYDLDDTIDQLATGVSATVGTGLAYVNIDDTQVPLQSGAVGSVSAPSSAAATTNTLVTDEGIAGGSSETWTYTIIYTVDSTATPSTGGACDTTSEGLSVSNSAALDTGASDEACVELSVVELVKSVVQTANADGTISAAYTVTVSNTGSGDGSYDLDDTIDQLATGVSATVGTGLAYVNIDDTQVPLQSGAVGSVSAPSSAAATTNTLVTDEGIAGGSSETWTYTIIYTVDSTATPSTGGACDTTSEGLSVSNSAALDTGASDEACVELPVVELVKSVVQTANADGTISAAYTVTVSNTGSGDGSYDLDDTIDQLATGVSATVGTGLAYVNIDDTQVPLQSGAVGSVSAPSSAAATTNTLVTDEGIAGGSSETWTYTIIYTVDSTATPSTGGACDTTSEGLSVSNSAALDTGASDEACVELPVVDLAKKVTDGPTDNGGGMFTVEYTITATNTGSTGVYDVVDDFKPGAGITLNTASIVYGGETDGTDGTVTTPFMGDGTAVMVMGESLAAGATETWIITAIFAVDPSAITVTGSDCTDDSDEAGDTGFANSVSGSSTDTDLTNNDDCVPLYIPSIEVVKAITSVTDTIADGIVGEGDTVNYMFTVTNTGNTSLSRVTISDEKLDLTDVLCVTPVTLAVGDTGVACETAAPVTYILTQADVDVGAVENTAEATGTPVDENGNPIPSDPTDPSSPPLGPVTDTSDTGTDPEGTTVPDPGTTETYNPLEENPNDPDDPKDDPTTYLLSPVPSLELIKSVVSVLDTSIPSGQIGVGDTITYKFDVINTGNVALSGVTISDEKLGLVDAACVDFLAVRETAECSTGATYVITREDMEKGGVENTAEATGTPADSTGTPLVDLLTGELIPAVMDTSDTGTEPADATDTDSPVTIITISDPGSVETEIPSELKGSVLPNDPDDPTEDPTTVLLDMTVTPISLGWFRSSEQPDGSTLFEWVTTTEVANLGFDLWTQDSASGEWIKLNDELIASQGDSLGAQSYEYRATGILGNQFRMTDVGVTGKQVHHGPFELGETFGVLSERKDTDWDTINRERERNHEERQRRRGEELKQRLQQFQNGQELGMKQKELMGPSGVGAYESSPSRSWWGGMLTALAGVLISPADALEVANFSIPDTGIYRVTHEQLLGSNVDLDGQSVSLIGLKERGNQISLKISPEGSATFGPGSAVEFAAEGLDTIYSGSNTVTLTLGEGQQLITPDSGPVPAGKTAYSYLSKKTYAPQSGHSMSSPDLEDAWFAELLSAKNEAVETEVSLYLDDYAPPRSSSGFGFLGSGPNDPRTEASVKPTLAVELWGRTSDLKVWPDHHVEIDLNGQPVMDLDFDGIVVHESEKVLSRILNGSNHIKIRLPRDRGVRDEVYLDSLELSYPRQFKAEEAGSGLVFSSSWNKFSVRDLESQAVTVFRLLPNGQMRELLARDNMTCSDSPQSCSLTFGGGEATDSDSKYYVSTQQGIRTAAITIPPESVDVSATDVKHLIIAHPDFMTSELTVYANELASVYGEEVAIVDVESIYATYSGHVLNAAAIERYIDDTYALSGTKRVTLIGGDVYDYRDYLKSGAKSFVPTRYVRIGANLNGVPSDAAYADIDGDNLPDIEISRLPVRTRAELSMLLQKRRDYLARDYKQTAVFATDYTDNKNGYHNFQADTESLVSSHFNGWDVQTAYVGDLGPVPANKVLSDAIESGVSLTSYMGHSNTNRWNFTGLLDGEDVADIANAGRPTVVTQWGCLSASYVDPEEDSMAHRFLVDESGNGAVVVMGATSYTHASAETAMADLLFARLQQGMRIGAAVKSAKRALGESRPNQLDILLGWTVLGPADLVVSD